MKKLRAKRKKQILDMYNPMLSFKDIAWSAYALQTTVFNVLRKNNIIKPKASKEAFFEKELQITRKFVGKDFSMWLGMVLIFRLGQTIKRVL